MGGVNSHHFDKNGNSAPWPHPCEKCPDHEKSGWGCGFKEEYRGKAKYPYTVQGTRIFTCPQYYWRSDFFQSIYQDLEDYRRGSVGNIEDLPLAKLQALRLLDKVESVWRAEQEKGYMDANKS